MPHLCFIAIDYHTANGGGGIASYVGTIAPELVSRGWKVSVIAKGERREERLVDGIRVVFWPFGNVHWWLSRIRIGRMLTLPVREWEWSRDIGRAVRWLHAKDSIDIIEGCETGNLFLPRGKIPVVNRLHGEQYTFAKHSGQKLHWGLRKLRELELRPLRRATMLTCPGSFHATESAKDLGLPVEAVHVIANPINRKLLEAASGQARLPRNPGPVTFLYTGRIEIRKGTLILFEAMRILRGRGVDCRCVIAGGHHASISDPMLQEELDRGGLRESVELTGHVPWESLVDLYRAADVFVFPSFYETFGISAIEAMAFGLPVVGARGSAIPEIVDHEVNGLLFSPGNPEELARSLERLAGNPEERRRFGEAGRERVFTHFTPEVVAGETIRLYRSLGLWQNEGTTG